MDFITFSILKQTWRLWVFFHLMCEVYVFEGVFHDAEVNSFVQIAEAVWDSSYLHFISVYGLDGRRSLYKMFVHIMQP